MLTNVRYILITALRDWLFIGLLAGILIATMISATLGSTAFLEEKEMTITFAAGAARVILMIGLIVFVCFHIHHAFYTKEIDVILSRPISRANLLIAYWVGFSFVAFLLTVPVVGIIGVIGVPNVQGFIGWGVSLLLETFMVIALALFSAFTMRSAVTSVLGCMGFYVLSRMMAFFIVTSQSGLVAQQPQYMVLKYILRTISIIVPRLYFFAKSEWLVYGFNTNQDWVLYLLQAVIFVPLLLMASIVDFRRKQF
jgi:ABC-type transport system involved in multi-copper enzyme maturation permease subunit